MVSRDRRAAGGDGRNRRFIARDERLTVGQAAARAGVGRETIKRAIRDGRLKAEAMVPVGNGRPWRRVWLSDVLQLFRPIEAGP